MIFPKTPSFLGTDDYEASYSDYEADGSLQAYNNSRNLGDNNNMAPGQQ